MEMVEESADEEEGGWEGEEKHSADVGRCPLTHEFMSRKNECKKERSGAVFATNTEGAAAIFLRGRRKE